MHFTEKLRYYKIDLTQFSFLQSQQAVPTNLFVCFCNFGYI